MKTIEERKAILDKEITRQFKNGWRLASRTETGCQLVKDKERSGCLLVLLFLFFIIPGIFYLLFTQGIGKTVPVEVMEDGRVSYTSKDVSTSALQKAENLANIENEKIIDMPSSNGTNNLDLGLLSSHDIAVGLKITEEDVNKLIEAKELKGKKIGDKFFVRSEDFDAFMKKE